MLFIGNLVSHWMACAPKIVGHKRLDERQQSYLFLFVPLPVLMCVLNNRNLRDDKRPRISLVKGERNVRSDHLSLLDFYIHIRLQIRLALNLVVPENRKRS